jgi:hypothetical protein
LSSRRQMWNAEDDFNAVAGDLNPQNEGAGQNLLAGNVQKFQPIPHPGGKLFQAPDHQGKFTLGLGLLPRHPTLLFEAGSVRLQTYDVCNFPIGCVLLPTHVCRQVIATSPALVSSLRALLPVS